MIIETVRRLVGCALLVLIQVLIANKLHIFGYATPLLYVYALLKIPSSMSRNELLIWGFTLGLTIDLFSNTPGMHAAASTFLAFILPLVARLYLPKGEAEEVVPGIYTVGLGFFVKYSLTAILLHHGVLFLIESFSFWDVQTLLLRVTLSAALTWVCVLALDSVNLRK